MECGVTEIWSQEKSLLIGSDRGRPKTTTGIFTECLPSLCLGTHRALKMHSLI